MESLSLVIVERQKTLDRLFAGLLAMIDRRVL
jgi:hypothetical protein